MRQRYRHAANAVTGIGAAVGLVLVLVLWPEPLENWLDRHFLLSALMGMVAFALGSRLIALAVWRLQRRRNLELWD